MGDPEGWEGYSDHGWAGLLAVEHDEWWGGAWVTVDTFISGDDVARVVPVPLHPLLHSASSTGASIVIPAHRPPPPCLSYIRHST